MSFENARFSYIKSDLTGCTDYEACLCYCDRESDEEDETGLSVAEVKANEAKKNTQNIKTFFTKKNQVASGKVVKKTTKLPKYLSSLGLKRATKLI